MQNNEIFLKTSSFLDNVIKRTTLLDALDAAITFAEVKEYLARIVKDDPGVLKIWNKVCALAVTVFSASSLNDMVKIVWRIVKDNGGNSKHMICCFCIGVTAILVTARERQSLEDVDNWQRKCEEWMGTQLTIGGKGVTGDGEGSTSDRISRFFNTPYLHDFD